MKKITLRFITGILACFVISENVYSQCSNQVMDTSGTTIISGVSINVISFGAANTNIFYCASTTPYNIGYLISSGNTANSGYTFQFTPAVDSVTLNFSGISNTPPYQEIVMLEINGSRYSIPSAGAVNGCDAMAVLTPDGYVTGCSNCSVSGWNGTTIAGPVSTVTVIDSAALNGAGGNQSLFSLFFCYIPNTGIANNLNADGIFLYHNSSTHELTITTGTNELFEITLYSVTAEKLFKNQFRNFLSLRTESLSNGIYFYEVKSKNGVIKKGKVILR